METIHHLVPEKRCSPPPPFLVGGSKEREVASTYRMGGSECVVHFAHFIRGLGIATPWIVQRKV